MLKDAKSSVLGKNPRHISRFEKRAWKVQWKKVLGAFAEVEDGCVFMETVMHVASRDRGLGCWMIWRYWMNCWMIQLIYYESI